MEHPSDEILRRFAIGQAGREERRAVVAHLIQGCFQCARKLRALMKPKAVAADSYDPALQRFNRELLDHLEVSVKSLRKPVLPPPPLPFGLPRGRPGSSG